MTKSSKKKKKLQEEPQAQPWIKMSTGVKIIALTSVFMAILTAWQVIPAAGWLSGILWGLGFGAFIWVIFFGFQFIIRLTHR